MEDLIRQQASTMRPAAEPVFRSPEPSMRNLKPLAGFKFSSSTGVGFYETIVYAEGSMSCDCPGWRFVKKGQERDCKHLRQIRDIVPALLSGQIKPEAYGGVMAGKAPVLPAIPIMPTPPEPEVVDTLRKRIVRDD